MFNTKEETLKNTGLKIESTPTKPVSTINRAEARRSYRSYIIFGAWSLLAFSLYQFVNLLATMSIDLLTFLTIGLSTTALVYLNCPLTLILGLTTVLSVLNTLGLYILRLMVGVQSLRFWFGAKKEYWFPYTYVLNETAQDKIRETQITLAEESLKSEEPKTSA